MKKTENWNVLSVSQQGWMSDALGDLDAGEAVQITVSGKDALAIVSAVQTLPSRLPVLNMFSTLASSLKTFVFAGMINVPGDMIIPVLTALGALGGAVGSVAFVGGVAVSRGYRVGLMLDLGAFFDPTDDKVVFTMSPPDVVKTESSSKKRR